MALLKTPRWKLDRGWQKLTRVQRKLEARQWRARVITQSRRAAPAWVEAAGEGGEFVKV
jgi:hypothetical protein